MGIDSTANLLFSIGAETDDAESNIQRFRSLMGKDLDGVAEEFADWAKEVLGDLSTVQGAMKGVGAGMASAVLAIATAALEAGDKYAEYVGEIDRGVKNTGIAAEAMSGLKFAAHETGTSYDALVTGLTRFASTVAMANEGGEEQQKMFARLGVSQAQVKAGERDLMPLLMSVADSFQHMGSQVQRSAAARDLFSRGGSELIRVLSLGSDGLRRFAEEARELGMEVSGQEISTWREYRASVASLTSELEAVAVEVGRRVLPVMEAFEASLVALIETAKEGPRVLLNWVDFSAAMGANFDKAARRIEETAEAIGKLGSGSGMDGLDKPAKEATQDYRGLSDAIESMREKMHAGGGEMEKAASDIQHIGGEAAKLTQQYYAAANAGKLTAESARREAGALGQLQGTITELWQYMSSTASAKIASDMAKFGQELQRRLNDQGKQTLAIQWENWGLEIEGLRAHLTEMKDLSVAQRSSALALIDELEKAGYEKIAGDRADALSKAESDLDKQIADQQEKSYAQQIAAWNREIDGMRDTYAEKDQLTDAMWLKLETLQRAGADKINAQQQTDYTREITGLQEHLAMMLSGYMTQGEKLRAQYQKDLQQFSDAELQKVMLTARTAEEQVTILTTFESLRDELTRRYGLDLQALANSQGWQGVFGSKFEDGIKHNESLMKQWSTSTNQSALMVKVTLESLKEQATQTFESFAQGMGSAIAQAIAYQKSIGAAMEAALKSTLESLAARAITQAIYATAWGFMDLAEQNYAGASAAFTSAAIFGTVGAAAGVAGSLIPSASSGGGASGSGGAGSGSGANSGASTGTTPTPATQGPNVHVVIQGHVIGIAGIQELTSAINDAVLNRDVTLTATNTKTSQVVTR